MVEQELPTILWSHVFIPVFGGIRVPFFSFLCSVFVNCAYPCLCHFSNFFNIFVLFSIDWSHHFEISLSQIITNMFRLSLSQSDFFWFFFWFIHDKKYHTVRTVLKSNRKTKKYHTVRTVLKSNRKTKNTTLSEQF